MSADFAAHPNFLASSRILIIGGTAGIGAAASTAALAGGARLHISSSSEARVSSAIASLKSVYPDAAVSGSAADLSDTKTVEVNVERVLKAAVKELGGPLDHIAFTAGDALVRTPLAEIDPATVLLAWTVRYLGPLAVAKLVAANPGSYLKVDKKSSLTLTSGTLGRKPRPGSSALIPVTGAVETLTRSLAVDLAPIRVNVVIPGPVLTELLSKYGEEAVKGMAKSTLLKAVGAPAELAEAYMFAMRSAFVTGQDFIVDGGGLYA